ncbi:MAG: TolC family protein [Planctomycetota bacterium]
MIPMRFRLPGPDALGRRGLTEFVIPAAMLAVLLWACTPALYRRDADRVAYDIVQSKQSEALGRSEPFTVETPAETLRRRLLLDQHLPFATPASLSSRDIEPIKQWPDKEYLAAPTSQPGPVPPSPPGPVAAPAPGEPLRLTLADALQVAAHESRTYQTAKETVFRTALALDLERDTFRRTWSGIITNLFETQLEREVALDDEGHTDRQTVRGNTVTLEGALEQRFRNGLSFSGALGLDLVCLLTQERLWSRGIVADITISLPLLRGSGEFVVTEPLTQAERDVVYAIYTFEQFKRTFAVDIASTYYDVLQQVDQVRNAEDNYRNLIASTRRARRLADAGRLPEIQVDQSRQDELRARQRWVAALESYQRRLDAFKLDLGLPADAAVELDRAELDRLVARATVLTSPAETAESEPPTTAPTATAPVELIPPGVGEGGRHEIPAEEAVLIALANRPDLRVAVGRVHDAQRGVAVAADQLRADVTLLGTGSAGARRSLGSVSQPDAILRPDEGVYTALLTVDLPFERTAERNLYRTSLIGFEETVRDVQDLEDQIKVAVRNRLSELREARESIEIQAAAVAVARRRVESTNLFLEAGRAEIRDVLEAQDSLVSAQNALTSAMINYRVGELALQRDLGVLEVAATGLWQEYEPNREDDNDEQQGE